MRLEEIGRYDPYTDKFIKNTTTGRIEVGTDGSLHNLSISNSYGLYAKNQEELDKCDYIDKSAKLYTKDEVIAMFEELHKEIIEMPHYIVEHMKGAYITYNDTLQIIQEKINSLKVIGDEKTD